MRILGRLRELAGVIPRIFVRRLFTEFHAATQNCRETQRDTLRRLLSLNADSRFSIDNGLTADLTAAELRQRVPVTDYDFYSPHIEKLKSGDHRALLGSGNPLLMFSLSSGTTQQSKFIPITRQFLSDYRRGWHIWGIRTFDEFSGINSLNILQLTSDDDRFRSPGGTPCGNISGLAASMQKKIVRTMYSVPAAVAKIEDPVAKQYTTMRLALADANVGLVATANPSTLIHLARLTEEHFDELVRDIADGTLSASYDVDANVREQIRHRTGKRRRKRAQELERIVEQTGQCLPKDYWPHLQVVGVWTGGSVGAYLHTLRKFYGDVPVRDHGLSASEGRMTIPLGGASSEGVLDITSHYFEFIPEEEQGQESPTILEAHELEPGRNYFILMTTSSGFYRYDIHDVVRCTGYYQSTPMLEFLHKGAHISNVTGEKISESQVVAAVRDCVEEMPVDLKHFTVAPVWGDTPQYQLFVESHDFPSAEFADRFVERVDSILQKLNCEYREKRQTGRLADMTVVALPEGTWTAFTRQRQKRLGGSLEQYKHPCLVPSLDFATELMQNTADSAASGIRGGSSGFRGGSSGIRGGSSGIRGGSSGFRGGVSGNRGGTVRSGGSRGTSNRGSGNIGNRGTVRGGSGIRGGSRSGLSGLIRNGNVGRSGSGRGYWNFSQGNRGSGIRGNSFRGNSFRGRSNFGNRSNFGSRWLVWGNRGIGYRRGLRSSWGFWLANGYNGWGLGLNVGRGYFGYSYSIPVVDYYNPYCAPTAYFPGVEQQYFDYSQPLTGRSSPNDPGVDAMALADDSFRNGDFKTALSAVDKAAEAMPQNADIHQFRSLVLLALERYRESAAAAHAALVVGRGWNWETLRSFYPTKEAYTEHLRQLEAYRSADEQNPVGRFLLGYHYMMLGHSDAAGKELAAVVAIEPSDRLAAELLAGITRQTGKQYVYQPPAKSAPVDPKVTQPPAPTLPSKKLSTKRVPAAAPALAGSWKATHSDGTAIALKLLEGNKFVWTASKAGKTTSLEGVYTLKGSELKLISAMGSKTLEGTLTPAGKGVLLDFTASWCGPCQQMKPVVSRLVQQGYPIRKINVDAHPDLVRKYRITGIPAFVLVVKGKEVSRVVGYASERRLKQMLAQIPRERKQAQPAPVARSLPIAKGSTESAPVRLVKEVGSRFRLPFLPKKSRSREQAIDQPAGELKNAIVRAKLDQSEPKADLSVRDIPMAASARIRVKDERGVDYGSGTVIFSSVGRTVILTCGHIFRGLTKSSTIEVDVFKNGKPTKFVGTALNYDLEADVGLIAIPTQAPIPVAPIATIENAASRGEHVVSIGCGGGADPSKLKIQVTALNRYRGPDNIECTGVPKQGRSGGGLFNAKGEVIGVCFAADPRDRRGLYAGLRPIHQLLTESRLKQVLTARRSATDRRSSGSAATIRAQDDSRLVIDEDRLRALQASARLNASASADAASNRGAALGDDSGRLKTVADVFRKSSEAEVICVIRPLDDPQAASRVVIINRASKKFVQYLNNELRDQPVTTSKSMKYSDAAYARTAARQIAERVVSRKMPRRAAEFIGPELADVEAIYQKELQSAYPYVTDVLAHVSRFRGKRLRPMLLLLTATAVGKINRQHKVLSAVVEMIHTATLVHDDVLDEASSRRHVATVNARWNNETSVLFGDYLFTHAFHLAATLETTLACRLIGRATNVVCEGELTQIRERGNLDLTEDEYLRIIDGKTAELCALCCFLGAHFGGADEATIQAAEQYGRNLGMAFQIADDVLDLIGQESETGKSLGTDFEKQKLTLPLIHLLSEADEPQAGQLREALSNPTAESCRDVLGILESSSSLEYARNRALEFAATARAHLQHLPETPGRLILEEISEFAALRKY
eukprot:g21919.t1